MGPALSPLSICLVYQKPEGPEYRIYNFVVFFLTEYRPAVVAHTGLGISAVVYNTFSGSRAWFW